MIFGGEFIPGIDLIDVALWAFTIFFFGLVVYLQMEAKREGYPAEEDTTGKPDPGIFPDPPKKTFILPHGREPVTAPPGGGPENRPLALARTAPWPGAPYAPTGDPMRDGVGPASYSQRQDVPDLTDDGRDRIVPYRSHDEYEVAKMDADPRGMPVYGADGKRGGVISDIWVDQSEAIIRYLEVSIGNDANPDSVLLPMPFAKVNNTRKRVDVHAINGAQFAGVPRIAAPMRVTRLEEDKICGYYGGGKLYANAMRSEPLL